MHQVTNPAIDPLREGLVMSLEVNLGKRGNILEVGPENVSQVLYIILIFGRLDASTMKLFRRYHSEYCLKFSLRFFLLLISILKVVTLHSFNQVILSSPVLNEGELESLLKDPYLKPQILPTFFNIRKGIEGSLEKTLYKLCEAADEAVRNGSQLLVLSDRSDDLVSISYSYVVISFAFS